MRLREREGRIERDPTEPDERGPFLDSRLAVLAHTAGELGKVDRGVGCGQLVAQIA